MTEHRPESNRALNRPLRNSGARSRCLSLASTGLVGAVLVLTGCSKETDRAKEADQSPSEFCSAVQVVDGDIGDLTMSPSAGIAVGSDLFLAWASMIHGLVGSSDGELGTAIDKVDAALDPLAKEVGRSSLVDAAENPATASLFDAIDDPVVGESAATVEREAAIGCGVLTSLTGALDDVSHIRQIVVERINRDSTTTTAG